MSVLEDIERLLFKMTRAEKAQLLRWVARDIGNSFPGIESAPDVCGGEPFVEELRRLGHDILTTQEKPVGGPG